MLHDKIIRAWKDPEFRASMSEEEKSQLPENPAGAIELTDDELDMATGGQQYAYRPSYRPSSMSSQSASASSQSSSSRPSQSASSNSSQSSSSNSSQSASARWVSASSNPSQSASASSSQSASSSNSSQSSSSSWRPWGSRPSFTWRRNF